MIHDHNSLSSHQVDLAAPPQCNDVIVLFEHPFQIYKHNC